jgi:hypothetical protein
MDPTTARYLVDSRHADLRAEAAAERMARQGRRDARSRSSARATGLIVSTRSLVATLLAAI